MRIEVTETAGPEDECAILEVLRLHNVAAVGRVEQDRMLAILVRGPDGATIGGLIGEIWLDWLFIDMLYLPEELRANRLGSRILRAAEAMAARLGCRGVWLDTLSFQARPFYEKHGFTLFATLEDYPPGHRLFFLSKTPPDPDPVDVTGFDITDRPTREDRAVLGAGLRAMNDRIAGTGIVRPLAVLVRDDAGAVVGGLWGRTMRDWMSVFLFALPPDLRGRGIGSAVLRAAEQEALARGCMGARLIAFSFQAPGFFLRHGYAEDGRITGYPPPHDRLFMSRRFPAGRPS